MASTSMDNTANESEIQNRFNTRIEDTVVTLYEDKYVSVGLERLEEESKMNETNH